MLNGDVKYCSSKWGNSNFVYYIWCYCFDFPKDIELYCWDIFDINWNNWVTWDYLDFFLFFFEKT